MGYVRTVVKRQIAATIDIAVQQRRSRVDYDESMFLSSDWRDNPEGRVIASQRADIARLSGAPPLVRDGLLALRPRRPASPLPDLRAMSFRLLGRARTREGLPRSAGNEAGGV